MLHYAHWQLTLSNTALSKLTVYALQMRAWAWVIMLCGYPALTHYAVTHQQFGLALSALFAIIIFVALCLSGKAGWLIVAFLPLLLLPVELKTLLYFPPIVINLLGCWLFARSLRKGGAPVISQIARLERGELTTELAVYTRQLTWIWAVYFLVVALISAYLAVFAPLAVWSLFTNLINYLLVGLLFFGEFAYRRIRYRDYRHASPFEVIRRMWNEVAAKRQP